MGFNKDKFMEFAVDEPISLFKPMKLKMVIGCVCDSLTVNNIEEMNLTVCAFYSHYTKDYIYPYRVCTNLGYKQCIPYEDNEHLLDTNDDCDEYYKNWN